MDAAAITSRNRSKTPPISRSEELGLDKDLSVEVEQNRLTADDTTHQWVISQPGVKISVKNDGMVRVPAAQLQTAGFNVAGDSTFWQLYLEGSEVPISVGAANSYIEFMGKGIDRLESDANVYYLIVGPSAGKRFGTRVARPGVSNVISASYAQSFTVKQKNQYVFDILNGEDDNYFGNSVGSWDNQFSFTASGMDTNSSQTSFSIRFQGYSAAHTLSHSRSTETSSRRQSAGQYCPFHGQLYDPDIFPC